MSIANKLYDRPHGAGIDSVDANNAPVLYVDGAFPDASVNAPYEGRIQVHNAIGACSVTLISAVPDLPAGYTLSYDSTTAEIVLKWPGMSVQSTTIPNSTFSAGDDTTWDLGSGWSIMSGVTAPDPNDTGNTQAQFANFTGESEMTSKMRVKLSPGSSVTASCDVQQGASSANKAGAAVRLVFEDLSGQRVGNADGNVIKSGTNSNWATSTVTASIPATADYVRIAGAAFRSSQNRPLWVDNFKWNIQQESVGSTQSETIELSLEVKDSTGRTAFWTGPISINGLGAQLSDWRYLQIAQTDNTSYSSPSFDDSGWAIGTAPFGGRQPLAPQPSVAHDYDPRFSSTFGTEWDPYTRLWIRRVLTLTEIPSGGYTVVSYIEDHCHFYINGVLMFSTPANVDAGQGSTHTLPASAFVIGDNSIAVQCDDETDTGTNSSLTYADFLLEPIT